MSNLVEGFDVSSAQGLINWKTVGETNKFSFGFCKATEGPNFVDPQFKNNWNGIKACGFVRGAYHFARTSNDPKVEADHFLKVVKDMGDLQQGDLLVLDIEVSSLAGTAFTSWVLAWLQHVEQETNITPIVYTGGPFFNQHVTNANEDVKNELGRFPLWLAAYTTKPDNFVPAIWKNVGWKIWQRSGDQAAAGDTILHIPGVTGNVDHNQFNGTVEELKRFAHELYNSPTQKLPVDTDPEFLPEEDVKLDVSGVNSSLVSKSAPDSNFLFKFLTLVWQFFSKLLTKKQ